MKIRINKQQVFNYYNKVHKWHGIIDYKSLTFILLYCFVIIFVLLSLNISLILKLYIFIFCIMPVFVFVIMNINEDCIIEKFYVIINYIITKKVYTKSFDFTEKYAIYKKYNNK